MFWKHTSKSLRQSAENFRLARRSDHPEAQWRSLFEEHSDVFAAVAELFLDGPCSTCLILKCTEQQLRDLAVPNEFRYTYALRSVALNALNTHIPEDCPDGFDVFGCQILDLANLVAELKRMPQLARAALFFSDVLGYSRREIALLLRVSDRQVDDLLTSARQYLCLRDTFSVDFMVWLFRYPGLAIEATVQTLSTANPSSQAGMNCPILVQNVA